MKTLFLVVLGIILAGLLVAVSVQRRGEVKLRQQRAMLQKQETELEALTAENQRLSAQLAQATNARAAQATNELDQLRQQREVLQQQLHDRAQAEKKPDLSQRSPRADQPPRSPEYFAQLHQAAGDKTRVALSVGLAMRQYALDHEGLFPTNVKQVATYLRKEQITLGNPSDFEIVYQGSLDALAKVPLSAVAVLRVRPTFVAPSGKQARVYGIADGSSRIVESDDDFKSWEAEHIVQPPADRP